MAEEKDGKVKVVDRRWFTVDGELKEPVEPAPPAAAPAAPPPPAPAAAPPPAPAAPQGADAPEPSPPPPAAGFLDLVDFLAHQAMGFLSGQVPGGRRDPATARFFIDMLSAVQEKTTGQLSEEEARYLDDVLYQLRSLFVASTG